MTFSPDQLAALTAPLTRDAVKQRKQGTAKVSYVEAWHVIAEANRIFGFDAWDRETIILTETSRELVELQGDNGPYKQWRVSYLAKVKITAYANGDPTIREGTGFGSGMARPEAIGDAIESAAKEAESDAMKRAFMTFGNPFGLALYDKAQTNVVDAPADPPKPNLLVTAAMTAITVCDTIADLKAWHMKNADGLKALTPAEQDEIARHYKARAKAVAPLKDETFRSSGAGGVAGDNSHVPEFN